MGFGFPCWGVFAGEAEDVFWKGQRCSAARGSSAVLRQRPWWPVLWWGLVLSHPSHCVTLSPAAGMQGKPYPFSGVGRNKINSRTYAWGSVGLLMLLGVGLNLWNERFISATTQKLEL